MAEKESIPGRGSADGGISSLSYPGKLLLLFLTFARIAALVVGGGLAILPVVEETFARKHKLLTEEDLLDMAVLVQSVPGIIAGNAAAFVGMRVAGFPGVVVSILGAALPSITVITIIAILFPGLQAENPYLQGAFTGVKACITGLIAVTAFKLGKKVLTKGYFELITFGISFFLLIYFRLNPAWIVLFSMAAGLFYCYGLSKRFRKETKGGR